MTDKKTRIVLSLQGPAKSGKTLLAERVLPDLLAKIGVTIEKVNDSSKGVFLTLVLPADLQASLCEINPQILTEAERAALVKEGMAAVRAEGGPRVGLANFDEVRALMDQRCELTAYASASEDMAGTVARMALPESLRKRLDPARTVKHLRADAVAALAAVDAALEAHGFDMTNPE